MTQQDYLKKLLTLCTDKQREFFGKIYKKLPEGEHLPNAIGLLERTLRDADAGKEEAKLDLKKIEEELESTQENEYKLSREVKSLTGELAYANERISNLKNPMNIDLADVQERLALLDALEAHGVDNWVGWDDAHESLNHPE